jgi:hypothetical protein
MSDIVGTYKLDGKERKKPDDPPIRRGAICAVSHTSTQGGQQGGQQGGKQGK